MLLLIVKYIHVLAAIVAVGFNISYVVWILRAQREPVHTSFALKGIQLIDNRIANPAYGLLLMTGLLMVFLGGYSLTTLWIDIALVLFVVLVLVGFSSTRRRCGNRSSSQRQVTRHPRSSVVSRSGARSRVSLSGRSCS
jgi:uncharacterized membrane protein